MRRDPIGIIESNIRDRLLAVHTSPRWVAVFCLKKRRERERFGSKNDSRQHDYYYYLSQQHEHHAKIHGPLLVTFARAISRYFFMCLVKNAHDWPRAKEASASLTARLAVLPSSQSKSPLFHSQKKRSSIILRSLASISLKTKHQLFQVFLGLFSED